MPYFGRTSRERLATCDPRLQSLLNAAILVTDFSVLCGYRSQADQTAALEAGTTRLAWPRSRHNVYPSRAVDVAPYPIDWADRERFHFLAGVIMCTADSLQIQIKWGGHWENFQDLPHFELR